MVSFSRLSQTLAQARALVLVLALLVLVLVLVLVLALVALTLTVAPGLTLGLGLGLGLVLTTLRMVADHQVTRWFVLLRIFLNGLVQTDTALTHLLLLA